MAISQRLKQALDAAKIRYTVAEHPVAYTAQEIAAAQHVPGRQLAKSVLVLTDTGPVLAVLPAIVLVDLKKLKAFLRTKRLSIGKEADIKQHFPDVEVGAMSPFGHLYGVPVVVDRQLSGSEQIVFNGGSHTDTVKLRYSDFAALAKPKSGVFAQILAKPARRKPAKRAAKRSAKRSAKAPARPRARAAARRTTKRARR